MALEMNLDAPSFSDPAGSLGDDEVAKKKRQIREWRPLAVRNSHASRNRNPGNLRGEGGSGGFARYKTDQEGWLALKGDIRAKQEGRSTAMIYDDPTDPKKGRRLTGDATLGELMSVYAPPSENDTEMYTKWLSQTLGVDRNTKIKDIDNEKLSEAIATYEDRTYWESVQGMVDAPDDEQDPVSTSAPGKISPEAWMEGQRKFLDEHHPPAETKPVAGRNWLPSLAKPIVGPGTNSYIGLLNTQLASEMARFTTRTFDNLSNLALAAGTSLLNFKGPKEYTRGDVAETPDTREALGAKVFGPEKWAEWYATPAAEHNPIVVGDEKRDEMFGAKPDGAWGAVEDLSVFVGTQAVAWMTLKRLGVTSTTLLAETSAGFAGAAAIDAHEATLANHLQDAIPEGGKVFLDWISAQEDDSEMTARVKHGMEMIVLNQVFLGGLWTGKKAVGLGWNYGGKQIWSATGAPVMNRFVAPIFEKAWNSLLFFKAQARYTRGIGPVEDVLAAAEKAGMNPSKQATEEARKLTDAGLLTKQAPVAERVPHPSQTEVVNPEVVALEGTDGATHHYPLDPDGRPVQVGETPAPKRGTDPISGKAQKQGLPDYEPEDLTLQKSLNETEKGGRPSTARQTFDDDLTAHLGDTDVDAAGAREWEDSGARVRVRGIGPNAVKLELIQVKKAGEKVGSKILDRITELADKHGITIELSASPLKPLEGGEALTPKQLRNLYRRWGFERTSWRDEAHMIRRPGAEPVTVVAPGEAVPEFGTQPHPSGEGFVITQDGVPITGSPIYPSEGAANGSAVSHAENLFEASGSDDAVDAFNERIRDAVRPILDRYGMTGKNAEMALEGIDFNFSRINSPQEALALTNVISKLLKPQMEAARKLGQFTVDEQKVITALTYTGLTGEQALALVKQAGENTTNLFAHAIGSETVLRQATDEFLRVSKIVEGNPSNHAALMKQAMLANMIRELQPATAELSSNIARALGAHNIETPFELYGTQGIQIDWGTVSEDIHAVRSSVVKNVKPAVEQAEKAVEMLGKVGDEMVPEMEATATEAAVSLTEATEQLIESSPETPEVVKKAIRKRAKIRKAKLNGEDIVEETGEATKSAKVRKKVGLAPKKVKPKKAPDLVKLLREAQEDLLSTLEEIGLKKKNGTRAIREGIHPEEGSANNIPRYTQDLGGNGREKTPVELWMGSDDAKGNLSRPDIHLMDAIKEAQDELEKVGRNLADERSGKAAADAAAKKAERAAAKKAADPLAPSADEMRTGVDDILDDPLGQGRGEHSPKDLLPAKEAKRQWTAPEGSGAFTGMTKQEIKGLSKALILTDGDPRVVARFFQQTRELAELPEGAKKEMGERMWDFVYGYRIRAMLSHPATHYTNIVSALNQAFLQPAELWLSSTIRGNDAYRQIGADLFTSAFHEAWDGLSIGTKSLFNGRTLDPETTYISEKLAASKVPWFGKLFDAPLIALKGEDGTLKMWLYRQNARASWLAKGRQAVAEGRIEASALGEYVDQGMNHIYNHNSGAWLDPNAITYARQALFQDKPEGELAKILVDFAQKKHPISFVYKWVNPFAKVGYNLGKWVVQRTPGLWRLSSTMREDMLAGGLRTAQARAKVDMGKALWTSSAMLAWTGQLTGGGPSNYAARQLWIQAGNQPYSIKVNGKWVSYRRLEPMATILGLAADAHQMASEMADDEGKEIAGAIVLMMASNATSKTYMKGLHDIMTAFDGTGDKAASLLGQNIASLVPSFFGLVNDDDYVRETHGILESIISKIPGWSKHLEPRQNFLGNPMLRPPHMQGSWNIFTVGTPGDTREERVIQKVYEIGKYIPEASHTIGAKGFESSLDDRNAWADEGTPRFANGDPKSPYYRLQELVGSDISGNGTFLDELDDLIQSGEFDELAATPTTQEGGEHFVRVKAIVDERRGAAMVQLLEEYPKLNEAYAQSFERKADLLFQ